MPIQTKRLLVNTYFAYLDSKSFILVLEIIEESLLVNASPFFGDLPKIIN